MVMGIMAVRFWNCGDDLLTATILARAGTSFPELILGDEITHRAGLLGLALAAFSFKDSV
jgi:hypothetical protein